MSKSRKTSGIDEQNIEKDYIYQEWKTTFLVHNSSDSLFFRTYEERYKSFLKDSRKHRDHNFHLKAYYKYILLTFGILQIGLLISILYLAYHNKMIKNMMTVAIFVEIVLAVMVLTSLLILSKTLDIHKHQETWARTRQSLHDCRAEMVRYVERLEPYSCGDLNILNMRFKMRILDLLDQNRAKFTANLEEKEKGLLDELSLLRFINHN